MVTKEHQLKTWPQFFEPIWQGEKRFEIRFNDRNFQQGDVLVLREYDPQKADYTGRSMAVDVFYILHGPQLGIKQGWVVMSIQKR